jgi:hypothetical protein
MGPLGKQPDKTASHGNAPKNFVLCVIVAVTLAGIVPAAAEDVSAAPSDTSVSLSSGLDYSSGKYGGTRGTDIMVALSDVTLKTGDFQFTAAMPFLTITGPAFLVVGAGGVPVVVNSGKTADKERQGWGDLNLSSTYSVPSEVTGDFQVDLTGRIKLATGEQSKGLSSGETDFGFAVDVSRQIGDWAPFVSFGYRVPGTPTAYSLVSAPSFSLGTSYQLGEHFLAIVSYDFDGTISSTLADSQQLFGSISWVATESLTFTTYGEYGVSSGAHKGGAGLLASWKVL